MQEEIKKEQEIMGGKAERISARIVQNLLLVFPNWHSKLVKPFRETLNKEMSLETYYCLETVKVCGKMSMTELARQMKVPKQQVTKLIDRLSAHHFVERVPDGHDRRVIAIRLTPEAVTYLDEYHLKNTAFIESLEEKLTEEELHKLNGAAEVLRDLLPKLK